MTSMIPFYRKSFNLNHYRGMKVFTNQGFMYCWTGPSFLEGFRDDKASIFHNDVKYCYSSPHDFTINSSLLPSKMKNMRLTTRSMIHHDKANILHIWIHNMGNKYSILSYSNSEFEVLIESHHRVIMDCNLVIKLD